MIVTMCSKWVNGTFLIVTGSTRIVQHCPYTRSILFISGNWVAHVTYDRLGKWACPRVNDNQKIHVDNQKMYSGRPHDY